MALDSKNMRSTPTGIEPIEPDDADLNGTADGQLTEILRDSHTSAAQQRCRLLVMNAQAFRQWLQWLSWIFATSWPLLLNSTVLIVVNT